MIENLNAAGFRPLILSACIVLAGLTYTGCATLGVTSAEEYYAIGMAYYEIGKFDEAEKWLNRARSLNRTQVASEYHLGRIAFETGRYREAAGHFEAIIKRDPENVMALRAAAYTRIKTGELEMAERFYGQVLALSPEAADDGYNHALVLYAMEKYAEAEQVLSGYQFALLDNNDTMLLYARCQKAQGKVEALDSYAKWLVNNSDSQVRYEYAQLLEAEELYARALEEYRSALSPFSVPSGAELKRVDLRFAIARLLLISDSGGDEGLTELRGAVGEGYQNVEALELLLADERISAADKNALMTIISDVQRTLDAAAGEADTPASEESTGE